MYEIEFPDFGKLPFLLEIIDVELYVWRHKSGLYGREVRAVNDRARKLISKFDCPDARTGADVESMLYNGSLFIRRG